jgi:hypothetical protein
MREHFAGEDIAHHRTGEFTGKRRNLPLTTIYKAEIRKGRR